MSQNRTSDPSDDAHCAHCRSVVASVTDAVLRCTCGSLIARYVGGRLELKCRRCKRTVMVSATEGTAG